MHSIRFKLVLLVAGFFLVSNALILTLLSDSLYKIADVSQKIQFDDRLSLIVGDFQRSYNRLQETLQAEAYELDFKSSAASLFVQSYYRESALQVYPMIVDDDGLVVAHPTEIQGSRALVGTEFMARAAKIVDGNFVARNSAGQPTWYDTQYFVPWGWRVIYAVPLDIKYADVYRIRRDLFWIMLGASLTALVLLLFFVNRLTRPIFELTRRTKEIAKGQWNRKLEIESKDEVGVLAENFNLMQDAIRSKIDQLASNLNSLADEVVQRKSVEEKLRASQMRLELATGSAQMGVYDLDLQNNVLRWDDRMFEIYGIPRECFRGTFEEWRRSVFPEDLPHALNAVDEAIEGKRPLHTEFRIITPAGETRYIESHGTVQTDENGTAKRILGVNLDVTERQITEDFVKRSQKMEALGQITGGVAHDFNNILGIILGNLEILESKVDGNEEVRKRLQTVVRSSLRAVDLTQQLLSFSRKEAKSSVPTAINPLIRNMATIIGRSVTPEINVEYNLAENLWLTDIDPGDFEDALLNLVLNARDAMPTDGELVIETSNKVLGVMYCKQNLNVVPGEYVQLAVSDTGCGIAPEIMDRIFDPFFTTKPEGKGTGLGMSMIFGFSKRSNGHVKAYSESGLGTTVRLYLPRSVEKHQAVDPVRLRRTEIPRGDETILVVDDEADLLEVAEAYLTGLGYRVVTASNGRQALNLLERNPSIDFLFSDVVMPGGMNGFELAEEAVARYGQLKVLLTSGFTNRAMARNGQARFNANLLIKPYNEADLALRLRSILDGEIQDPGR